MQSVLSPFTCTEGERAILTHTLTDGQRAILVSISFAVRIRRFSHIEWREVIVKLGAPTWGHIRATT